MRYRKLDENGDRVFGHSLEDFWIDVPEAPAQAVSTRLRLWQGQWFLNVDDGTPWSTKVLGKYTGSSRDPILQTRVLTTPGVTGIAAYASQLNRDTRAFTVQMTIDTQYGQVTLAGPL